MTRMAQPIGILAFCLLQIAVLVRLATIPEASTVPYPRNTTRDQLVASDYSFAPNIVADFYTTPAIYDLYVQKIISTIVAASDNVSFQEIMIRPPGESNAIYLWGPTGYHEQSYDPPFVCPGGTKLARYYSQSGSPTYHAVQVIGILKPHDPGLWSGGPGLRYVRSFHEERPHLPLVLQLN